MKSRTKILTLIELLVVVGAIGLFTAFQISNREIERSAAALSLKRLRIVFGAGILFQFAIDVSDGLFVHLLRLLDQVIALGIVTLDIGVERFFRQVTRLFVALVVLRHVGLH